MTHFEMYRRTYAKAALWVLALTALIVGICLIANPIVGVQEHYQGEWIVTTRDVTVVGVSLLCAGLLLLALSLYTEAYFTQRRPPLERTTPEA